MNYAPPQPLAKLPFALEADHIVVEARLNGRAGRFVLDTGSGVSALTPAFAAGLDLVLEGEAAVAGTGAAQVRRARAREVAIGPLRLADMRVLVLSEDPFAEAGADLAGTLGYDVFAAWAIEIDFPGRMLSFFDPSEAPAADGPQVVPLEIARRAPFVQVEVRPRAGAPTVTARLLIDTGTPVYPFVFSPEFAARAGLDDLTPRLKTILGRGAGGAMLGDVVRVSGAQVGGVELVRPFTAIVRTDEGFFASGLADGVLGQGLFRRGKMVLDYARSRMSLVGARLADWDYPDRSGFEMTRGDDGAWAVAFVGPGSPAERAGLAVGDRVLAIDGRGPDDIGRERLLEIMGAPGPMPLKVSRGAAELDLVVERRTLI